MPIKQLYAPAPDRPRTEKHQCQAVVIESPRLVHSKWREQRYGFRAWDAEKCQRRAQYTIDGTHYCALHAAKLALKLWVGGRLTEKSK